MLCNESSICCNDTATVLFLLARMVASNMAVLVLLLFLALTTEVLSQGERATLPLTLQPRPLKGCPSQDEISEIHDQVRSVLQDTVEPVRKQAAQDLNGTNSSDSTHCWVDHSSGDTRHCFSEEQWNKLQDDIKEGIYTELQGDLLNGLTKIQEMLWNTTDQIQSDLHNEITQVQGDLDQTESELNQNITLLHSEITQVQSDLGQTESELNQNITLLHSEITQVQSDHDRTESELNQIYTELQGDLLNGLTTIQEMLQNTTEQIQSDLHNEITQVQDDLESKLNHNITQLHTEITQVHSDLDHNITRLHSEITQVQDDLDQTESELNQNITRLENAIAELLHLLPNSCKQLAERGPSGYYSIYLNGTALPMYCDMDRQGCNSIGGWTRVAYLNMTDPTHQCPSEWTEITSPIRTCGKTYGSSCDSALFNTSGIEYTHVLGRAIGIEFGSPDEFVRTEIRFGDIDSPYVDGMSITHGMPREHVWTFVASCHSRCPCSNSPSSGTAPSFVGEDYFCEEGVGQELSDIPFHNVDDPLWDGQGCGTDACCIYNNPPWFCTQLPQATTDDIEIRLCADESLENEDIPIELIEIYIQ